VVCLSVRRQLRGKTQMIHSLQKRVNELEGAQVEASKHFTNEKLKLRAKIKKVG
jgi:hypothetical protein